MTIASTFAELQTNPRQISMATTDTLPVGYDTTALLEEGQSPSDPVVTLTQLPAGQVIDLEDDPTIDGNIVQQIFRGSALTAGTKYRIAWVFTAAVDTIWTEYTILTVPL